MAKFWVGLGVATAPNLATEGQWLDKGLIRDRFWQGRIELPKAARGHATFVNGKMLSDTKYRIQILLVLV